MPDPDPACSIGGSPTRRRGAVFGALVAMAVTVMALVGCEGAEPYFRNGKLGDGSGGGTAGGGGAPDPMDAAADQPGEDLAASDGGDDDLPADAGPVDGTGLDAGTEVGCGTCALGVLYWCEGTTANTIRATFSLVNDTPLPIPLREVTIRYWFTGAGGPPWQFACDNGMLGRAPGMVVTDSVTGTFHPVMPPRPGADSYFEVGFGAAAGNLQPQEYSELRTRVFRQDYSIITQTDDYSFNPKNITFAPSSHITLYRNGMLIDGVEPQPR